jgi:hypothetical protein
LTIPAQLLLQVRCAVFDGRLGSLSFANNRSGQKLLCCHALISVMKTTELWNCDNPAGRPSSQRFLKYETLMQMPGHVF